MFTNLVAKGQQQVAFTAMSSMGDLGVVIDFLRESTACKTYQDVASHLSGAMMAWGLRGAVQVRGHNGMLNYTTDGRMSPLQSSVLDTMRDFGRIFEMGSRAIINYNQISLLVENLPIADPDKVGRLRDHLAVLAESADMRIAGLDAMNERDLQKVGIHGALAELKSALARISDKKAVNAALALLEHADRDLNVAAVKFFLGFDNQFSNQRWQIDIAKQLI